MLLTDNPILIRAAEKNYDKFLVPTSFVEANKIRRYYTSEEQSDLDIKTSVNKIGEIVNLSQELNSKLWDAVNTGTAFEDVEELYCEIAKLDVLSNIEIDKAKREYAVNSTKEIAALRSKYEERDDDDRQIKPNFFGSVARTKGYYDSERKNYKFHETTMDYLQHSLNKFHTNYKKRVFLPFSSLMLPSRTMFDPHKVVYGQVYRTISLVREMRQEIANIWQGYEAGEDAYWRSKQAKQVRAYYKNLIGSAKMNPHTMYRLLLAIEEPCNKDVGLSLFSMLFSLPNYSFIKLIKISKEPVPILVEDETCSGSIRIHDFIFRKEYLIPSVPSEDEL